MKVTLLLPVLLVGLLSLEVVSSSESATPSSVEVTLKQGTISASKVKHEDGKYCYAFKNIPFAEPPVGNRRFKEPVPAGPWSGTRDGSSDPEPCPQIDMMGFLTGEMKFIGKEDCLYLNVHVPRVNASGLPVMVWIHGGAFTLGSIKDYSPEPLVTKDVIVVSIQYRLGTLGFLSTEDSVMPTNLGMKDQIMALKWVQENIRDFGGDPNKVTIFGESAGAISVHMHMMSPLSEGLFHRAIPQSGTAILPGFYVSNPRKTAIALGEKLECEGVDPDNFKSLALYDCLKDLPAEKMVSLASAFVEFWMFPQYMVPSYGDDFLPDHPLKLLKEGRYKKMNVMMGATKDEGSMTVTMLLHNKPLLENLVANISTAGPIILNLEKDEESKVYIAKRLFYHYLKDIKITEENAKEAVKMFTDLMFNFPMDFSAKRHAIDAAYGNKLYLYEFHHLGESVLQSFYNFSSGEYVAHGDELIYLFEMSNLIDVTLSKDQDKFMRDIMTTLWTNFARTGNPTPDLSLGFKWTPVTDPEDLKFMILNTSPYMRGDIRQEMYEFYMNLPLKQNKDNFPERFRSEF